MKLHLENLPPSLASQREVLARCLVAMNAALPIQQVILFGSHARGDAGPDSDVDLCLVAEGAELQATTARRLYGAIWDIWPSPSFSLVPISPQRLGEKRAGGDHFFATILKEGVPLAAQD